MLKGILSVIVLGVVALMTAGSAQKGCQDARQSLTRLAYFPQRDMRSTIQIAPQTGMPHPPDSLSVPLAGREIVRDRMVLAATFENPVAPDDSSIARGERKFMRVCAPCHGASLAGDGAVTPKFIPPPDLLGPSARERKDGYIYSYIRHGGAVMPSYGAQVTAEEAYDLINYIRHKQRTNPR